MDNATAVTSEVRDYESLEALQETGLKILVSIYAPILALLMWIVHFNTPEEMASFRLTMSNGALSMFLNIVFWSVLFRPMPLTPLPMATVKGKQIGCGFDLCGSERSQIRRPVVYLRKLGATEAAKKI